MTEERERISPFTTMQYSSLPIISLRLSSKVRLEIIFATTGVRNSALSDLTRGSCVSEGVFLLRVPTSAEIICTCIVAEESRGIGGRLLKQRVQKIKADLYPVNPLTSSGYHGLSGIACWSLSGNIGLAWHDWF